MRFLTPLRFLFVGLLFLTIINSTYAATSDKDETKINSKETKEEKVTPTPTPLLPKETPPTGINITLSPTFLNLVADPGEEVTSQIKVKNNNNFTEYLKIDLAKFESAEGGERPLISEFTASDTYKDWISFSDNQFALAPNETRTIDVKITPPKDATLGYYYAIIIDRTIQDTAISQGAVVSGAPAVLALLEVRSPNAKRELQLVDFKTKKFFYEYLPTEFEVTVKNTGNIHIAPSGDIFIDSMRSKDIGTIRANEGRGNILPGTTRAYTAQWNDAFAVRVPKEENGQVVKDEKGNTKYTTKFDFTKANKFRVGKYTANLVMIYDNGERDIPLQANVSFWVVPWRMIVTVLLIIITPAVLVYLLMRWRYGKSRR